MNPADDLHHAVSQARAKGQAALVEFLKTDIALAFTFLQTAAIEKSSDLAMTRTALGDAKKALATVRQFEARIEDPAEWTEVHGLADQLERAILTAENPN